MRVHPTAVIEDGAEIGEDVSIGPYCVIGRDVRLGDGVVLHSHVMLAGTTEIGPRTVVCSFAALGGSPQHLAYRGEKTRLIIGADNVVREHVTMNVGTVAGRGETRVGDRGFFMVGVHIAHDCIIGDDVIMANNATLGGHVVVGERAFLGGLSAVHQLCRIGAHAFIGGCAMVTTDVIPYGLAVGNHASLSGLNVVGMKRRGMPRELIHEMHAAFRHIFSGDGTFQQRVDEAEARYGRCPEIARILEFINAQARRPLMTLTR